MDLPTPLRVVVLASGSGTLMQALIEATRQPEYPAEVVAVGTDRHSAEALAKAAQAGVPTFTVRLRDHPDRAAWDKALVDAVADYRPDLVVSAGFMKLLGSSFLSRYENRVINTHPALLPSFPGMHAPADALAMGVKVSGATVHFVDGGIDAGPIIAQEAVAVETDDDEATLHERIKVVERRLLVEVIERLGRGGCTVDGRKVILR
ncbi:phosphoribosylglycinamide formyltransferase [Amycolatopsis alkalitolerans]|uniref:Phosphoribosylglycinamide formyltransferase n=1 Tax=Amycolatopsis alkalitolerans TaxID=2547244 RepID=A0A5C4LS11_9PSEU|nr:phosphoribosylglycinamide formyltransferase [Amycolatopsis alkalitolerans]TNC21667.1 phosphoribosylglycinamide formyltransferase [Amycolatopsis alkalitolerans]